MDITKEEFDKYEEVRVLGRTNMFMVSNVELLSGLERDQVMFIMNNYSTLKKEFTSQEKSE